MNKIRAAIISILVLGGCGRTKEKGEPVPPPSPVPPATSPQPKPPETKWPSIPGFPSFPSIPNLPNFPFPIPGGGGGSTPSPNPNPAPAPYPGDIQGLGAAINAARAARGLSAVEILPALNCAGKRHADDIGTKHICGHTGSDGSSPWKRAEDCGTFANGEIVACGQGDAKAAVDAWTLSPGHAAIMYDPGQKKMGLGMLNNFWVAIFQK